MADAKDVFLEALMGGSSSGANMQDLGMFQQDIAQNNIYGDIGSGIMSKRFDTSTWTPKETGLTTALQMFAGTLLKDLGERRQAEQLNLAASILPQLQSDPMSVIRPEGLDPLAFGKARLNAITRKRLEEQDMQKLKSKAKLEILGDLLTKSPELAAETLGIDIPQEEPFEPESVTLDGQGPDLGVPTAKEVYDSIYIDARKRLGSPPAQADIKARELTENMRKQSKALIEDKIVESVDLLKNLENVVNITEEGILKAGNTGVWGSSGYEALASVLPWAKEAQRQAEGDISLTKAGDVLAAANRAPGAQSDFELQRLLSTAPGPDKSVAVNKSILQNYKLALKSAKEKQAFLEYFAEKAAGNPSRVETLWSLYREQNPLTILDKETGEYKENTRRKRWQDFDFKAAYAGNLSGANLTKGTTAGEGAAKKPRIIGIKRID